MGRQFRHSRLSATSIRGLVAGVTILACALLAAEQSTAGGHGIPSRQEARSHSSEFAATVKYVVQFYPLWFTYYQSVVSSSNRLVGPARVTPVYETVVAINDDTLYASTFLDLRAEPIVLTIPSTAVTYSILTLDAYGNIFNAGLQADAPGTYALTGPGFSGKVPGGVIPIAMPLDFSTLIFRADKYSAGGINEKKEAEEFRRSIKTQTLSDYRNGEPAIATLILPVEAFSIPFKNIADNLIARRPIAFLRQLQAAVASSNTPPLSPKQQEISDEFDALFGDGTFATDSEELEFTAGARYAHDRIVSRYLSYRGPTNWIHFTNIGNWGRDATDRSAITEFCRVLQQRQYRRVYHAFLDKRGRPLDGTDRRGYLLRIPKTQLPEAKRFWSFTAYTPDSIELIRNDARKYLVASYTPGLRYNSDGSLSLYLARECPAGVPEANWLPIPRGRFNIMLRVYGPEGDVAADTYVPPGIQRR